MDRYYVEYDYDDGYQFFDKEKGPCTILDEEYIADLLNKYEQALEEIRNRTSQDWWRGGDISNWTIGEIRNLAEEALK